MNEHKTIVRVEKNKNYTVINNTALYDDRLSWKAKAIHAFMLSRPDNWTFHNEEIAKWAKDGIDSFISGLNELKKFGYVKREKRHAQNGRFAWITIVYEVPEEDVETKPMTAKTSVDLPSMEQPPMDKPLMENDGLLNTYRQNTKTQTTNTFTTKTNSLMKESERQKKEALIDDGWAKVVAFYHQNVHPMPAPIFYEKLEHMYKQHPIPELALEALQHAVLNNAKNPIHYAESILIRWRSQNIRTVEQARAEQMSVKTMLNAKNMPARRTEIVPAWFHKRNAHAMATNDNVIQGQEESINFEAERQKILARLGR